MLEEEANIAEKIKQLNSDVAVAVDTGEGGNSVSRDIRVMPVLHIAWSVGRGLRWRETTDEDVEKELQMRLARKEMPWNGCRFRSRHMVYGECRNHFKSRWHRLRIRDLLPDDKAKRITA